MIGIVAFLTVVGLIGCFIWWLGTMGSRWIPFLIGTAVLVVGGGILLYDYTKTEVRTIVVEGKDRGADDGSYRVYTDGDTLSVQDIWFTLSNFRTNSADLYGDIEVCRRYKVTVRGWESGFFSEMPNIDRIMEDLGPVEGCVPRS